MNRLPRWLAHHLAALRVVVVLTLTVGLFYPLAMTGVAQAVFGHRADGSVIEKDGAAVGSELVGQSFTGTDSTPILRYFQSRPSAAGDGYDPGATGAGNQGSQSVVDVLPDPADPDSGKLSLLTQVCARSVAVGELEGVSGARPYCTSDGVGAVLGVFREQGLSGRATRVVSLNQACPAAPFVSSYEGVTVECARPGDDYSRALVVPVRGNAPARPVVPADAVTASGSGLDPHISPAYAALQAPRVARERGLDLNRVKELVADNTTSRGLGFLGEPGVNVLTLNLALDRES
ncbi:potassium-transporting ATPase subunit C [Planotetraspora kaengkrachanensis]|uniref:Potassium-transporting ATPase KdpC subunit n=1 Tax=Planotetraspora kaengkrachanensis TaxID=575193 RepID=A0A8J3M1Z3_9ACTN|nr:potassium-transporting ATPase subunit C [Planotetraspora kaengkrachanensis]GIG77541.1 potassium-transporting ATPase KdpC subunit [Planotetraspora kaengkrachanensis]